MISETCQTLALHFDRASRARDEVMTFIDELSAKSLDDFERVKVIDSFIFRFIKIQDLMGNKLFREVLDAVGEYESSMSILDILDRMEKLELIASAELWLDIRNLRNVLTHEYPDNRDELIDGIKLSLSGFTQVQQVYHRLSAYIVERGLM